MRGIVIDWKPLKICLGFSSCSWDCLVWWNKGFFQVNLSHTQILIGFMLHLERMLLKNSFKCQSLTSDQAIPRCIKIHFWSSLVPTRADLGSGQRRPAMSVSPLARWRPAPPPARWGRPWWSTTKRLTVPSSDVPIHVFRWTPSLMPRLESCLCWGTRATLVAGQI